MSCSAGLVTRNPCNMERACAGTACTAFNGCPWSGHLVLSDEEIKAPNVIRYFAENILYCRTAYENLSWCFFSEKMEYKARSTFDFFPSLLRLYVGTTFRRYWWKIGPRSDESLCSIARLSIDKFNQRKVFQTLWQKCWPQGVILLLHSN